MKLEFLELELYKKLVAIFHGTRVTRQLEFLKKWFLKKEVDS